VREIAELRDHWAGIPMPIEGAPLVLCPKYPNAAALSEIGRKPTEEEIEPTDRIRNSFYSHRYRCVVIIGERAGRIVWGIEGAFNHLGMDLKTLGASDAWGIEQESKAVHLLGTLVKHRQMKQYLLTGMFLERSPRTGLSYLFRRLKPTVVIDARRESVGEEPKIKCALCLHPIGYYQGSWAGAMCPTDDVVAHLLLMRGDEVMFWRKANQIAPWRAEAGL
jgi:hypothetical protein